MGRILTPDPVVRVPAGWMREEYGVRWLAAIVIGIYALGMLRAWTLCGDPQHGWSGWLKP